MGMYSWNGWRTYISSTFFYSLSFFLNIWIGSYNLFLLELLYFEYKYFFSTSWGWLACSTCSPILLEKRFLFELKIFFSIPYYLLFSTDYFIFSWSSKFNLSAIDIVYLIIFYKFYFSFQFFFGFFFEFYCFSDPFISYDNCVLNFKLFVGCDMVCVVKSVFSFLYIFLKYKSL